MLEHFFQTEEARALSRLLRRASIALSERVSTYSALRASTIVFDEGKLATSGSYPQLMRPRFPNPLSPSGDISPLPLSRLLSQPFQAKRFA